MRREETARRRTQGSAVVRTVRRCLRHSRERDIVILAAALSYYTIISIVPLLTLLLFVTATFQRETVGALVIEFTGAYLLPAGQAEVLDALQEISVTGHHTVIGVALSLWGGFRLFASLDRAFVLIFESERPSLARRVSTGLLTLLTVGLAVVAAAVLVGAIGLVEHPESHYGPVLLVAVLVVSFFPIYYFLPDVDLAPREVLPGATFAAVAWTVLSTGFGIYIALLGAQVVGLIGSFLLLLTWFYLAALAILFGGVLNAILSGSVEP
jgi:YihY family inner membrane protein